MSFEEAVKRESFHLQSITCTACSNDERRVTADLSSRSLYD